MSMFEENYKKEETVSQKSRVVALILCLFLGLWGAPYFYVGRYKAGLIRLFTWNFLYIGFFIDLISIYQNHFTDKDGLYLN